MKKYSKKRYDGTPSKRKFYGFNFYIQCNEKLSKTDRGTLLTNSKNYLGLIYHSSSLSTEEKQRRGLVSELDSSLTDLELLEIWNPIYEEFGCRIPQLEERWYRDNGVKDFGEEGECSEPMGGTVVEFLNSRKSKNEISDLG
jgi:hypothetical protein